MIIMEIKEHSEKHSEQKISSKEFVQNFIKYLKYAFGSTISNIYIGISTEGWEPSEIHYLSISTKIPYSIDSTNLGIFTIISRDYNYMKSRFAKFPNDESTEININLFRSNRRFYEKCCNIIKFNCAIHHTSRESIDALMSIDRIFKTNTIEVSIAMYRSIRYLDYSNVLFIAVDEKNETIPRQNILPQSKLKYLIGDTTQITRSKHPEVLMTNKEEYYRSFEIHEIPSILLFFTKSKLIKNSSQPLSNASTQTAIKLARIHKGIHKRASNLYPMIFDEHKSEIRISPDRGMYVIQLEKRNNHNIY
jgi:hypothetical protein